MSSVLLSRSRGAAMPRHRPSTCWHQSRGSTRVIAWHRSRHVYLAAQPDAAGQQQQQEDEGFEGLLPEEDVEVPGTYMDAMSSNTKLGKAVRAAVEELEHLGDLETEVLQQCDDLLKKLGMKGSIFGSNPPPQIQQQQQQQQSGGTDSSS